VDLMAGVTGIDEEGVVLSSVDDRVVDVLFDGRRIWSFRGAKVAQRAGRTWRVPWPQDLRGFLKGVALVTVRTADGEVLAESEVRFGDGEGRVTVAGRQGLPLVIDPGGRLVTTFDASDADQLRPLVDAIELVLAKLTALGLDAFPAYGTLLGAVRDRKLIGHDNDADVAYLSRHTHPADVILESFRIQRLLHRDGFEISRYSGGAFKVTVRDSEGVPRGLDVFAGFLYDGRLVLLGEIFEPFEESWLRPLGTVELEGRRLPAPADPDRLLTAKYGPSWRVPDPTFKFETAEAIRHRLDMWFRGTRTHRNGWDRRYSTSRNRGPNRKPHELARMLHGAEPAEATIVDVGCGRGQDAVWLSRRGHQVFGLDFSGNGFAHLRDRAAEEGWSVELAELNLLELRHTLAWGARLARIDGPRAMLARHLLNATTQRGRANLWRLAQMTIGDGGRLYAEFLAVPPTGPSRRYTDPLVWALDPEVVESEAVAAGATVVSAETVELDQHERPTATVDGLPAYSCRMVMEWGS
jgi:SAM-dependent methyltransferase